MKARLDSKYLSVSKAMAFGALIALITPPVQAADSVPESRIYGGEAAKSCEWPTAIGFGSCSGTLVHPKVVIYAAHCGKQRKISFGDAYKKMHRSVSPKFCKTNPAYTGNSSLSKGVDFAFCYLEEAITDFPITPVAYGCELDQIKAGTKIWLVGYGNTDKGGYGTKHKVETEIKGIIAGGNELKVGGEGKATCNGDSGGPGYVKMSDGTWRHVAISSYGFSECGAPSGMTFSKAAIPWIHKTLKAEGITDVDLVPCYNDEGEWEPTKKCRGFATEPGKAHGNWEQQCGGDKAPRSGFSSICGPAFGDEDNEAPEVSLISPESGSEIALGESVTVKVKASDDGDELEIGLLVNDEKQELQNEAPYEWTLNDLELGKHRLVAVANDGSKESNSKAVTIEVVENKEGTPGGDSSGEDSGQKNEGEPGSGEKGSSNSAPSGDNPQSSENPKAKDSGEGGKDKGGCAIARPGQAWSCLLGAGLLLALFRRRPSLEL